MTTSPLIVASAPIIAATAGTPLTPGSESLTADKFDFRQVLQQAKSGGNSDGVYAAALAPSGDSLPVTGKIAKGTVSGDLGGTGPGAAKAGKNGMAGVVANICAASGEVNLANIPVGSRDEKDKSAGKAASTGATLKPNAKTDTKEGMQTLSTVPDLPSNYVVPVTTAFNPPSPSASITPAESIDGAESSSTHPGAALCGAVLAVAGEFKGTSSSAVIAPPEDSSSGATPADADRGSGAADGDSLFGNDSFAVGSAVHDAGTSAAISADGHLAFPTLVPESTSQSETVTAKAKPVTARSIAKDNPVAPVVSRDAVSVSKASRQIPAFNLSTVPETEAVTNEKPTIGQPAGAPAASPASGDKTVHFGHAQQPSKPGHDNPSAAQEKTAAQASSFDHDSIAVTSTMSAHPSLTQTVPSVPAAPPAASAPETAQSASPVFATAPQYPVPASTQAHPQVQSNPIPDPPRMVDSGQLRVNQNSSELKISVQVPELGKIEVRAVTAHDVTTAHLTASHPDALRLLATDRTSLEQTLKSRDVILGSLNSHAQGQSTEQQRQQNSDPPNQFHGGISSNAAAASSFTETISPGYLPDHASISVRA